MTDRASWSQPPACRLTDRSDVVRIGHHSMDRVPPFIGRHGRDEVAVHPGGDHVRHLVDPRRDDGSASLHRLEDRDGVVAGLVAERLDQQAGGTSGDQRAP